MVLSHPAAIKSLSAGRVVVVDNGHHANVLAVVLHSGMGSNNTRIFTVLFICDKGSNPSGAGDATPNDNLKVKPVKATQLFLPEGVCWHHMAEVKASDIAIITTTNIKVDADKIMKDVKKREQPRFK